MLKHVYTTMACLLLGGLMFTAVAQDPAPVQLLPDGVTANVTGNRWTVKEKNLVVAGNPNGYYSYFAASTEAEGEELWVTDGKNQTTMVADLTEGAEGSDVKWLARFNDKVVCQAQGKLYIANVEGMTEIKAGEASLEAPMGFTQLNETQFVFTDATGALYISDGVTAEVLYADAEGGFKCIFPGEFNGLDLNAPWCRVGRKVYFKAETEAAGRELWVTDGTTEGTHMVKDINIENDGKGGSAPEFFVNVDNKYLVFKAWSKANGNRMWYTDGTEEGTKEFVDPKEALAEGENYPRNVAVYNHKVYTASRHDTKGVELFSFDPYTGEASFVYDFTEGGGDSWPDVLGEFDGKLWLVANAGGCALWSVDADNNATKHAWAIAFPDNGYKVVNGTMYTYGLPINGQPWGIARFDDAASADAPVYVTTDVACGTSSDGIPCGYTMVNCGGTLVYACTSGDGSHAATNCGVKSYYYSKEGGVTEDLEIDFGPEEPVIREFYLVGWINGAAYGIEGDIENFGDYKFENGTVTAQFNELSYVQVKDNAKVIFGATAYVAPVAQGSAILSTTGTEKVAINGNVQVVFTLVENEDGTLTLSYAEEGAGLKNINEVVKCQKMIMNGHIVIMKNGVRYDILGAQVR